MMDDNGVRVPFDALSSEALTGVIDEFISREGTDYGHEEHSFSNKRQRVRSQLESGEVVILFDPNTGTVNLVRLDSKTF